MSTLAVLHLQLFFTMLATGFEIADIASVMLVSINLYNDANPQVRAFFTLYVVFVILATTVSI